MLRYLTGLVVLTLLVSCSPIKKDLLYGTWKVESITTAERKATGEEMGNPVYTFTKEGKRVKTIIGHDEAVDYQLKKGEISYPGSKLPSSKVKELTAKKLVLKNETAEWVLYKD